MKKKNNFIKIIQLKIINIFLFFFKNNPYLIDSLLNNKINIFSINNNKMFSLRNYGNIVNWRANSFFTKEPQTILWINNFHLGDKLIDVGANIGIYSLYSAYKGHQTIAFEPHPLNLALLNLNIYDNCLSDTLIAYPFALDDNFSISEINIEKFKFGDSGITYNNDSQFFKNKIDHNINIGACGITIDDFVSKTNFFPNHIKIDVDGNELKVLKGAIDTISKKNFKSISCEINKENSSSNECLTFFKENNFIENKNYLKSKNLENSQRIFEKKIL